MVGLSATPEITLADEPVKIFAWGLAPQQLLTLRAWLKDERGEIFQSHAFYSSDSEGKLDLDHSAATGGDFQGVCPMGLLWALKSTTPFLRLTKLDVMGSPFHVHLELYTCIDLNPTARHSPVVTKTLEIWYAAPGVQRLQVKHGRVRGTLFLPPGEGPFPGIIDIFGAAGGLVEFRSSLLASRGFASLALAYFAYDDLPSHLWSVDLEYFEEAAEILLQNPKVSGDGVGVIALCKGAEIALAMATYLPQVKATVCINGTNAVNGNSLTYRDICINGIQYQVERMLNTESGHLELTYVHGDTRSPDNEDCILPLEKARGPILFVIGENNQTFNSMRYAKEAKARADRFGKKDIHLLSFPGAGHLLFPPGSPFSLATTAHFMRHTLLSGGNLIAHCKAQETCWRMTQDFFHKNMMVPSKQSKL